MKTIGIIAEYNPFHNGHAYQIAEIRKRTGADFIVIAMSGNFVQRGAPAVLDKYTRTHMALNCGADIVFELPVIWATASAEDFAMAGVALFDKMGCIDGICFGAETDNLPLLSEISELLVNEPAPYRTALSDFLKQGMNFPAARTKALLHSLSDPSATENLCAFPQLSRTDPTELSRILGSPNNILALEYLKAIKRRKSSILPLLLKREGAGYHDASIRQRNASATAIRQVLGTDTVRTGSGMDLNALKPSMPEAAFAVLTSYLKDSTALWADDFSSILGYQLLTGAPVGFLHIADIGNALSNRLVKNIYQFESFSQFCELNKSRDTTYTHISRGLLHLLLDIQKKDDTDGKKLDYIPYLRILGFRKDASNLLTHLKKHTSVPVLSKLADASLILSDEAYAFLKKDLSAAELYETVKAIKRSTQTTYQKQASPTVQSACHEKKTAPRNEYVRGIVLIP